LFDFLCEIHTWLEALVHRRKSDKNRLMVSYKKEESGVPDSSCSREEVPLWKLHKAIILLSTSQN
jgi:hypothetical protein